MIAPSENDRAEAEAFSEYCPCLRSNEVAHLAEQFAAVRAEERARIVAWLRAVKSAPSDDRVDFDGAAWSLADDIEDGDHEVGK